MTGVNTNNSAKGTNPEPLYGGWLRPLFVLAIFLLVVLCYDAGYSGLPSNRKRYAQAKAGIANLKLDEKKACFGNPGKSLAGEFRSIYESGSHLAKTVLPPSSVLPKAWKNLPHALQQDGCQESRCGL